MEEELHTTKYFFDTMDVKWNELYLDLDLVPYTTHVVSNGTILPWQDSYETNIVPAISIEAWVDLFNTVDLELNQAIIPVIFETRLSLVITYDKEDFPPNTFEKIK